MPPVVAPFLHLDFGACSFINDHGLDRRTICQRFVNGSFERNLCAATIRAVLRDNRHRLSVVDAINERVRGKAAEDYRMSRAYAGARQHRDWKLRRHAHVNRNRIAFLDAERFERVGEFRDFHQQLIVSERSHLARLAFPDQSGFVFAPRSHVTIKTVVGNIDLAADEPLCPRRIPFEHLIPCAEPVKLARYSAPEFFRVGFGFAIDAFVLFEALDVGLLAELFGRLERRGFLSELNQCSIATSRLTSISINMKGK